MHGAAVSRTFFILDAGGERRLTEAALPLRVGGGQRADIVLPGLPEESIVATIALSQGHAFVQPEDEALPLYHNHERLLNSAWLKSGDQLEADNAVIDWEIKGDQVFIRVGERVINREPVPPRDAPPGQTLRSQAPENPLPVNTTPTDGGSGSLLRKLMIGLFSLLLLATAAFVLLATPVQINIEPAPDRQSLQGKIPALPLWGRRMALPGEYTLTAERKGYQPLNETIRISPGSTPRFDFRLKELPGRIKVHTSPEIPFHLFVDSVETEMKEGIVEIDRGRRLLLIESERYLPEEKEVEIKGLGESQQVEFDLRPAWAELAVSSIPAGAEAQLDDRVLGTTPLQAEAMQGPRTLTLTLAGHKPLTLNLAVEAGKPLHYENLQLQPLDGRLLLESDPAGATVTVDGEYRGITPLTLTLSSGQPHALALSKPGYQTSAQQAQVAADEERQETVKLQPEYGVVFLRTQPADAELLIDGKPAGKATRRLRLPARPHELEIRKPGYTAQKISMTPRAGESQSIEVELKTGAQRKAAKIPATTNAPGKAVGKSAPKQSVTGDGPTLLIRPGGPFTIGASRREAGRRANESLRKVQLTRPYYLGAKEVTNAEYRRFRPQHDSGSLDGARLTDNNQPVVNVSWDDAARYCNWLSKQSGL
ncbi:MAG: PEGA domain-containing protein, partial [Pseudomonadota bacterium]|nr:PEGA domain-containing protein [Pseudomonadota bacterium]